MINHLFNKAALSLDDGLDLRPKARTGARHLCSLHGSKPINNSLLQRLQSVVVDPVYGSLTGYPHIIIQRIAVWATGWPHILPRQIVGAPGLSQLGRNLIISEVSVTRGGRRTRPGVFPILTAFLTQSKRNFIRSSMKY